MSPVCDTCIPSDTGYGRGQNTSFGFDPSNRLLHVDIQIIKGMTDGTALKDTFAHELGHSFGLLDCDVSAIDANKNPLYDCSKSVMATSIKAGTHGWDYWAKNASNGTTPSGANIKLLPGPTNCDLSVIDQGLPDYRQCFKLASLPPDTPTCTNGAVTAFADTGGLSSTYTCGNTACDGCNPNCTNFAPQKCNNSGGQPACSRWCGSVCMDKATCSCPGESPTCQQNTAGYFPSCNNNCSPIVLDAFDEGFHFTGIDHGVRFRVAPDGPLVRMSWPDQAWRNGWLALDRNGNGKIDDFTELFGNVTPQPVATDPNGYLALAVFDDPMNGGNGNGVLDPNDSVYDHLSLWIDANHNGISEPEELHSLREMGLFRIDLKYHKSNYVDANGNRFRYRSRVWDDTDKAHDICYDVFLSMEAQVASGNY